MNKQTWDERLPQLVARFPLSLAFLAILATLAIIAATSTTYDPESARMIMRGMSGAAVGSTLAAAGVLFREGGGKPRWLVLVLVYTVPIAAAVLLQFDVIVLFEPHAIEVAAVLWLGVAGFVTPVVGGDRDATQRAFWWFNHIAFAMALLATLGFLVVWGGLAAIDAALSLLLNIRIGHLLHDWLVPISWSFLAPAYWLSVLPRRDQFEERSLSTPDILSKAIGILGQFVLIPLVVVFSLILAVYAVATLFSTDLPIGRYSWMYGTHVLLACVTYLFVFPPFLDAAPLVRAYRSIWFWLILPPLALLALVAASRIGAHGLTDIRVVALGFVAWGAALAALFIFRRGDARLVPALAIVALLAVGLGPQNSRNLGALGQLDSMEALLALPGKDGESFPPDWTDEQVQRFRGAASYLAYRPAERELAEAVLARYGLSYGQVGYGAETLMTALGHPHTMPELNYLGGRFVRVQDNPVDMTQTPYLLGQFNLVDGASINWGAAPQLVLAAPTTVRIQLGEHSAEVDLLALTDERALDPGFVPTFDFELGGRRYRLLVQSAEYGRADDATTRIRHIELLVFSDRATPSP